ncbi:MFS general substrate transporter [Sistotremastrum suecicum HHB10207 ss-3]|uniref:MFS general substrate transporter n=1 Tax=Sistotremastrum suecicum HHB10207 ss-3 TaxID=1314776 RepID=A0A166EJ13_9AGAM|nr:MFS general substrate transporter [Sistotremastrum suecicum HHB10207 ss-3]
MALSPLSEKSSLPRNASDIEAASKSSEDEKALTRRILWKFDLWILPPLALPLLIEPMLGKNARIVGLQTDTHLKGNDFNTALAVFYVPYILIELPSNWILKKFRPNRWLPFIVVVWGIVTTLTGLVQNFGGLIAVRLALGLCEGGMLPGMILYLSTIYKRHELQLRVGIFYASASLSGAFGGLLASAIVKLDGHAGLAGWRWIFILEGIASVLIGVLAAVMLPQSLATAKFLTPEERQFACDRFQSENKNTYQAAATPATAHIVRTDSKAEIETSSQTPSDAVLVPQEEEAFEWREVIRGLLEIQVWITGFAYLGLIVSLYSFSLFLPTIVSGLGFSGERAQLHTVPPYVPATVLTIVVAFLTIAGYILIIVAKTNTARYVATFLIAAGVYPRAGHYKKATTTALQLALANTGGFIATFAYTADQAPRYIKGHSIALSFVTLAWILTACNVIYCKWENKARSEGRRQGNIDKYQELWDTGKTRAPIGQYIPSIRFIYFLS